MMLDIYKRASQILVWLGESDRDIRKTMLLLEEVHEYWANEPNSEELGNFLDRKLWIPGIKKLFAKPWWSRMWVVQEVAAAQFPPLICCGRSRISWDLIRLVIVKKRQNSALISQAVFYLGLVAHRFSDSEEETRQQWVNPETLFLATSERQATQPHDKVFALLGLLEGPAWKEFDPSYLEPCEIIYQKAMIRILKSAYDLRFLVYATHRKSYEVPSWCIDFSKSDWAGDTYSDYVKAREARHIPKPEIFRDIEKGTLTVSGYVLGTINHCKQSAFNTLGLTYENWGQVFAASDGSNLIDEIGKCLIENAESFADAIGETSTITLCQNCGAKEPSISQQIWLTLNNNIPFSSSSADLDDEHRARIPANFSAIEMFARDCKAKCDADAGNYHHKRFPKSSTLHVWACYLMLGMARDLVDQTLIATASGYIGKVFTGVREVEKGDLVCCIRACPQPVILRPRGDTLRIVAFCNITGFTAESSDALPSETIRRFVLS